MKRIKKTIAVMLAFGMLASGVGTGDEQAAEAKAAKKPSIAKKATVMEGQEKSLAVKASGFKIKSITAKSSDKSVLKVKAKKKTKSVILTGVSNGTAKVTATIKAVKNKKTKTYKLTTSVTVESFVMHGYENIDVDYDVDTGKVIINASVKMGLSLLDMFVPGGKVISKGLDSVYSDLSRESGKSGGSEGVKEQLDTISKDIASLKRDIDEQYSSLKGQVDKGFENLESKIVSQSVISSDGALFDKLSTSLEAMESQIDIIMNDKTINDETKAVFIADLIGRNSQWTSDDNNLIFLYKLFMNSLSSATFKNQNASSDLYEIVFEQAYNSMKNEIMFANEARQLSDKYIQSLMLLGLKAYTIASFCLKAHQLVSTITEDSVDPIARDKFKSIRTLKNIVDSEIVTISKKMFDAEMTNSVTYHLNNYLNNTTPVFVNKGTTYKVFKKKLSTNSIIYGADYTEPVQTYGRVPGTYITTYVFTKVDENRSAFEALARGAGFDVSGETNKAIIEADAIANYVYSKNKTLREFLTEVGFDLSDIYGDILFLRGYMSEKWGVKICGNRMDEHYGLNRDEFGRSFFASDNIEWMAAEDRKTSSRTVQLCMFELDK